MIVFDDVKFAKSIMKEKIEANDPKANFKLKSVARYMKDNTTYKQNQILDKLKKISEPYFENLPEQYSNDIIEGIVKNAPTKNKKAIEIKRILEVIIYQEELDKIISLNNRNAEKLAFVFLVYSKFMGHKWIDECNADLYRLAGIKASGSHKNKLIYKLSKEGIVKFNAFQNKSYFFTKKGNIINLLFTVPIQLKEGEGTNAITITNFDNIILYYQRYRGYSDIIDCSDCGCPIGKVNNKVKYCSDCAIRAKRKSNEKTLKSAG